MHIVISISTDRVNTSDIRPGDDVQVDVVHGVLMGTFIASSNYTIYRHVAVHIVTHPSN